MLEWQSNTLEEDQRNHQEGMGPYPPPQRACLVCEKEQWIWNGHQYLCGSGHPVHVERMRWTWIYADGKQEVTGT